MKHLKRMLWEDQVRAFRLTMFDEGKAVPVWAAELDQVSYVVAPHTQVLHVRRVHEESGRSELLPLPVPPAAGPSDATFSLSVDALLGDELGHYTLEIMSPGARFCGSPISSLTPGGNGLGWGSAG